MNTATLEIPTAPSFGKLLARKAHFGSSGNGTPYISDGDSARVLFFANMSGAYNGNVGIPQAAIDMQTIAHRVNAHDDLVEIVRRLALATDEGDDQARGTHYVDNAGVIRCKGSFLELIEHARAAVAKLGA